MIWLGWFFFFLSGFEYLPIIIGWVDLWVCGDLCSVLFDFGLIWMKIVFLVCYVSL